MTRQEAVPYLIDIVSNDKRHKHYYDELKTANLCRTLLGNTEEQQEILLEYTAREDEIQREQRVRLTNTITRSVLSPALAYMEEVVRADGIKEEQSGNQNVTTRIQDHFANFYRGENLMRYCFEAAKYAAKLDPNYWTVFAYLTEVNAANNATNIKDIYPIEVPCRDVVDYKFDETGTLQYLCFSRNREVINEQGATQYLPEFYFYGVGYFIHMPEIKAGYSDVTPKDYSTYESARTARKSYLYRVFDNRTREVPAIRWSAYLSDIFDNEIGCAIYEDAIPLLKSLIRDVSFFDVHKVLHLRAEKFQYVKPCSDIDEESGAMCDGGYYGGLRRQDRMCRSCAGSGKMIQATEQATTTLAWPERKEDVFNLAALTYYAERPLGIIEFFRSEIDRISMQVMLAIYSQQAVSATNLARVQTATQATLEFDKINNKLTPFAAIIERGYELAWRIAYNFYGTTGTAMLAFPADFKLQSIDGLIGQYNLAKDAGLPYEIMASIRSDILKKQFKNDPTQVQLIEALEIHRPLKSKRIEEAAIIFQMRDPKDPERQLWEQWDNVVNAMKQIQPPFQMLDFETQRAYMYEAAAAFAENVIPFQMGGDSDMQNLLAGMVGDNPQIEDIEGEQEEQVQPEKPKSEAEEQDNEDNE